MHSAIYLGSPFLVEVESTNIKIEITTFSELLTNITKFSLHTTFPINTCAECFIRNHFSMDSMDTFSLVQIQLDSSRVLEYFSPMNVSCEQIGSYK